MVKVIFFLTVLAFSSLPMRTFLSVLAFIASSVVMSLLSSQRSSGVSTFRCRCPALTSSVSMRIVF